MQQHYERMPTTIDPNLLMARNIAHYGENTASMIRGQYESGAYSSSKETIAGDFATAKQMASRPPFPPTPNSKDTRMSPHQQEGGKRFSPALSHHPAAGHLELLPPALAATMMQYGQGFPPQVWKQSTQKNMTLATGCAQDHVAFRKCYMDSYPFSLDTMFQLFTY